MTPATRLCALGAVSCVMLVWGCAEVATQAGNVTGAITRATTQGAPDTGPPQRNNRSGAGLPDTTNPALKASRQAEQELLPDRTCTRPLEKFDITAKAVEYAGTEAQLRLKRFTDSDFKFTDLTPADRKFLNYLAVTTIWVPLTIETYAARVYDMVTGKKVTLLPMQRTAKEEAEARLKVFRDKVAGFPGDVRFEVNGKVSDGVYAELGALVTTSPGFLGLMEANGAARDLLLSHELSHVYKRHRLKQLQTRLVTASAGFDLAKKLIELAYGQSSTNPVASIAFIATSGPALIEFVRQADLNFSKEQELEADACAAVWLQRANVDRCAAWRGFAKIAPKDGAYALTHPATAEREANYFRKLDGVACSGSTAPAVENRGRAPNRAASAAPGERRRVAPM